MTNRRIFNILALAVASLLPGIVLPATAGSIPIATLSLFADFPGNGLQELSITNQTGIANGCNAFYVVCDTLAITDWTLTVTYTSSYYNASGGPSLPTPYTAQWASSADDILPTLALAIDFDLCNTLDITTCPTPTTAISKIEFHGRVDQSSFAIFDAASNGGAGGAGPLFFADQDFDITLIPSGSFPANIYESQDGSLADQSTVPEPGTLALTIVAVVTIGSRRKQ